MFAMYFLRLLVSVALSSGWFEVQVPMQFHLHRPYHNVCVWADCPSEHLRSVNLGTLAFHTTQNTCRRFQMSTPYTLTPSIIGGPVVQFLIRNSPRTWQESWRLAMIDEKGRRCLVNLYLAGIMILRTWHQLQKIFGFPALLVNLVTTKKVVSLLCARWMPVATVVFWEVLTQHSELMEKCNILMYIQTLHEQENVH